MVRGISQSFNRDDHMKIETLSETAGAHQQLSHVKISRVVEQPADPVVMPVEGNKAATEQINNSWLRTKRLEIDV